MEKGMTKLKRKCGSTQGTRNCKKKKTQKNVDEYSAKDEYQELLRIATNFLGMCSLQY